MKKLIRITTVPLSLEKLLEGQLSYMSEFYDVTAISAEKERLKKYGEENGVKTFFVDMTRAITPLKDLKAVLCLYKFLRREKPLIVHTHTPKAGIVGMLAAKLAGVPIRLHTVAGLPLLEVTGGKRKILNNVEKITYACATKVYPNSMGLKDIILKENFAPEDKYKVLGKGSSNGIDTEYFNPALFPENYKEEIRGKTGIPKRDLIYVFVGRLVSEKGINELVKAFVKLHRIRENVSLLLVGPYEQDLDPVDKETIELIETHEKIFSVGYQVDVRPYLAISDVLVFPSYREGFPNVVMQAGAMQLPSVVTNINGCNEIIQQGENGIVIPKKNEEELLNAMKELNDNEPLRERLKSRSRKNIEENFKRKEFWKLLLDEYKHHEALLISKPG